MNALTRDLVNLVNTAEENQTAKEQTSGTQFREKLHLMPPVGWLNERTLSDGWCVPRIFPVLPI